MIRMDPMKWTSAVTVPKPNTGSGMLEKRKRCGDVFKCEIASMGNRVPQKDRCGNNS
jgi:hypothetical protein